MNDRFLRDLVASASVDRAAARAEERALARLGLGARGTTSPRGAAGALLAVAVGLVVCGLRAASFVPAGPISALPQKWSVTPECADTLEAPPGQCEEASAAIGAGSSSGSTAPGSSGG